MSLAGEINKISGDVHKAINRIAKQGVTDMTGMPRGTRKISGYICNIHTDGDLIGTVDVQEYNYEPGEYSIDGVGHHEGVFLSAIQNNQQGYLIVPMLFSDVIITQNPSDGREYVVMYSHAQQIRLSAFSLEGDNDGKVELGVTEVKQFEETDNGLTNDYDELETTKNKTSTIYTAQSIIDQIASSNDTDGYKEEKTSTQKEITVGDTKITIDGQNVSIESSGKVTIKVGSATITEEDGKVSVEANNCEVKGSSVTITGGQLKTQGVSNTDLNGPFNAIKVCPFSGAPHCGSQVSGT
jgi:hypothetical protein